MLVSRGGNERAQASAVERRAVEFFGCGFLVRRLFRSVRWPPSVGCSLPVSQFGPGLWRSLVPRAGNPPKSGRKARESERGQASPRAALPWEEPRGGREEGRSAGRARRVVALWRGYLVDPASSICLSQRLSHACLSTHGRYSETANGSLNQLWFLWSLPSRSLDNCGNSRANTCRRAPTSGDACIYQTKTNPGSPGGFGDSR